MSIGFYEFSFGEYACVCLSDGSLDYPLQNFFANVPLHKIEVALKQRDLPNHYITTPYTYLFVDTQEHKVLVDMGAGNLGPRTGKLLQSIQAAGIDPEEIDTVVITHAHPDHIGGTLNDDGLLNYPNASYYISRNEWEFWFSEAAYTKTPESFVEIAHKNLDAIKARMQLVEGKLEIVPGIHSVPTPGHTPGHIVVEVVSGDQNLYYIGDAVIYPLHLEHPDWLPIYDIIPEKAAASKHSIFDQIANQGAWVVGQHFPPFPSLGHVIKGDGGWEWQPVEING